MPNLQQQFSVFYLVSRLPFLDSTQRSCDLRVEKNDWKTEKQTDQQTKKKTNKQTKRGNKLKV